jgi:surface polysaccharide O-acyltransferase-like enzyme
MQQTRKKYNYCLDFLKGFACMFVVFMHCEFPGMMGVAIQAISRFCVPFFFMVSGYFCFRPLLQQVNNSKVMAMNGSCDSLIIKKKVYHIARITLYASLFYIAFALLRQALFHNQNLSVGKFQVLTWFVFNKPFIIAGHLWFLFALLYAYIFYGLLERFNLRKFAYVLACIMFVVYVCLAQGAHLAGVHVSNHFYRNWLIEAFPFFMLGHWIHENQDRINISNKTLFIIIFVTTLLCLVERNIMGRDFGVNIVTIPQVFALFVYGVKNPTRHEGAIQRLGRDCSMMVYIIHIAIWVLLDGLYKYIGVAENFPALYLKPVFVVVFSILFALLFNAIVAKVKSLKTASITV